MCTVSFIKTDTKIIITSNRDEQLMRPSALPPKNYTVNGKNVIYPKDPKAGGTWYVVDENGTVLVLLNGANEKHVAGFNYRKSRGLIVLDIIGTRSPRDYWNTIDLDRIEPFTIVLFQDQELFQLRWNGADKEAIKLDVNEKHIWSSSTLYPKEIREERADLFQTFLEKNNMLSEVEMYGFHRYTEEGDQENGLVINRNEELKTLSITQTIIEKNKATIVHHDLITQEDFSISFITI
ncbi:NRDE family protein [Flavobacterium frigoris]|uniref:Transport and Golgi organisation 2 n=1 Tax=Flavobacterium frigoris TaxID=229204 RepID=A0A1H9R5C0_FLAFI|nr:NRDE family protein [Flavobacterium frigoris]SER67880.1 Transport and Golgi organisation 2 [Flavobacterium frigoris]